MSAALEHTFGRMTLDEFLIWDAPGPTRWQLVDGQPQAMAPTIPLHGLLHAEITSLVSNHLRDQQSAGRLLVAPAIVPRVGAAVNVRIPDIGVTCAPMAQNAVVDEPVLLIEILSPSNEQETRTNVWAYTTIPSVREILLVRASRIEAELLRRGEDGNWPDAPVTMRGGDSLTLDTIEFRTPLAALYRTTGLPQPG